MPLQHPAPALPRAAPHRRPGAPAERALRAAVAMLGCWAAPALVNPAQAEPAAAPTGQSAPSGQSAAATAPVPRLAEPSPPAGGAPAAHQGTQQPHTATLGAAPPAANAQAAWPAAIGQSAPPAVNTQAVSLTANAQTAALATEPSDPPAPLAGAAPAPLGTATAAPQAGAAAPAAKAAASMAKASSLSDKGLQVKALAQGVVSYYANYFSGRSTANGERFDQRALTMAHRSLPFGTLVRVVCLRTERSVVVRVNDRGPFVGNRVADLSRAAAEQLNMVSAGLTQARLEVLGPPASVKASAKGLAQALPPAVAAARR